jgi:hypothetical protein
MSDICKVVRVKSTHPESQGDFVEINETDFVEGVHELYDGPVAVEAKLASVDVNVDQAKVAAEAKAKLEGNGGWGGNPQ